MLNHFFLNPKRKNSLKKLSFATLLNVIKLPIQFIGTFFGFQNIDFSYCHGKKSRLKIGKGCSTMNTIFNTNSGNISIGSNSIFGHNCMVLTGTHNYRHGKRISLIKDTNEFEVPFDGRDITIGSGCFISSGATIIGPCEIGNDVIIAGGALVPPKSNIPDNVIYLSAKKIKKNE